MSILTVSQGLLLGSDTLVARIRVLVDQRPSDPGVPQLGHFDPQNRIDTTAPGGPMLAERLRR